MREEGRGGARRAGEGPGGAGEGRGGTRGGTGEGRGTEGWGGPGGPACSPAGGRAPERETALGREPRVQAPTRFPSRRRLLRPGPSLTVAGLLRTVVVTHPLHRPRRGGPRPLLPAPASPCLPPSRDPAAGRACPLRGPGGAGSPRDGATRAPEPAGAPREQAGGPEAAAGGAGGAARPPDGHPARPPLPALRGLLRRHRHLGVMAVCSADTSSEMPPPSRSQPGLCPFCRSRVQRLPSRCCLPPIPSRSCCTVSSPPRHVPLGPAFWGAFSDLPRVSGSPPLPHDWPQ